MRNLELLPLGQAEFLDMRTSNFLYIDKTEILYQLAIKKRKYFFHRPRRFGKSLTISTLDALFRGEKECFQGLWIADKWDWAPRPVIRLNFSLLGHFKNQEEFEGNINTILIRAGFKLGLELSESDNCYKNLGKLLDYATCNRPAVILIDEYDYPIHSQMNNPELQSKVHIALKEFYTMLKGFRVEFLFITGVTKFSSTSLFSGMNDIDDVSLSSITESLCGITQKELEFYFKPYIKNLSKKLNVSYEKTLIQLKQTYNGYRFSLQDKPKTIYNPYSLLKCFEHESIENYWFESGTPSFLWKLFQKENYNLKLITNPSLSKTELLDPVDLNQLNLVQLLYQTGYLTIGEVKKNDKNQVFNLMLRFPNNEVEHAFFHFLANQLTPESKLTDKNSILSQLKNSLVSHNLELFFATWQSIFAAIPSVLNVPQEKYYHTLIFVFAYISELNVLSEQMTSDGRIDMIIELKDKIYLFEFKLGSFSKKAIEQIENKKYYLPYQNKGKPIVIVGVAFDPKKRTLDNWISKEL